MAALYTICTPTSTYIQQILLLDMLCLLRENGEGMEWKVAIRGNRKNVIYKSEQKRGSANFL